MTTENEMAVAIATEIGKQVPVKQAYNDAASPAIKQVGATLEDLIKCVRLVGFPIQWLAVQQDRFRAFIERSKEAVPQERLVLPPPQLLGPILEGIRYEFHDDTITQMFESLLSKSMDSDGVAQAHPSYPALIRQLSPDEGRILLYMLGNNIGGEIHIYEKMDNVFIPSHEVLIPNVDITQMDFYVDHLVSLSLAETVMETDYTSERIIEDGVAQKAVVMLTPLGKRFIRTCMPRS